MASAELVAALARRSWPGNLRQLKNEILRLDALANEDVIGTEHLAPERADATTPSTLDLKELERRAIAEALRRTESPEAPWTVIEGSEKYGVRILVLETLVRALRPDQDGAGEAEPREA